MQSRCMPTVERPKTPPIVNDDPHHADAVKRCQAAVRTLQERGIIDAHGNRVRKDLPPDMQEGSDGDFGG